MSPNKQHQLQQATTTKLRDGGKSDLQNCQTIMPNVQYSTTKKMSHAKKQKCLAHYRKRKLTEIVPKEGTFQTKTSNQLF